MANDIPSHERPEPGSHNIPLGKLPATSTSTPSNPSAIANSIIEKFNYHVSSKDAASLTPLFIENSYWRDHLVLSPDFRTINGVEKIVEYILSAISSRSFISIEIDTSSELKAPHFGPIDAFGEVNGIEFFVFVSTDVGFGHGVVRLAQDGDEWRFFTVFSSLVGLTGKGERLRRSTGVKHGEQQGRKNWLDRRNGEKNYEGTQPDVLVVGAGQAGLSVTARLKWLGIDTLVIDREEEIGDSWRNRYHQLVLHDPVWFDHMPHMPFPPHWPIFTPKDKLAEFFESYVKLLELNVWTRSEVKSSSWDEEKKKWTVVIERRKADGSSETRTLHPAHVIQATGHSGKKNLPNFKGMENFKGDRICHSSEWPGAQDNAVGKKAVVVGACNSAHDIVQDYCEKGYEVTMVQRSSTCVVSSESIVKIGLKGLYEEAGPPTQDADLYLWSIPPPLFKLQQTKVTQAMNKNDAKTIEGLEKAGFKVDRGPMDAGLLVKYLQRGGGYYIDVGASQLIVDGKVKVKHGQEISEVLPNGLRFADGSELEADEIVFATGYQNMRTQARAIFGDELADRVGDIWGWDEEGEMRTIWRKSGHPGFWFMGGNLALCRYYSRLLALQIQASLEGVKR